MRFFKPLICLVVALSFFTVTVTVAKTNPEKKNKASTVKKAATKKTHTKKSDPKKPATTTAAAKPPVIPQPPEPITFDEIDDYVKRFATQGLHRAGSRIDRRTAKVLQQTLKRGGLKNVVLEKFTFKRPISRGAMISMKIDKINSRMMPGMPYLGSRSTGGMSRRAELGFLGQDGKIPVMHLYVTPSSATPRLRAKSLRQFKEAVASGRYPAVIGITQGGYTGLLPLMVDLDQKYKTPAILISSSFGNFVEIYAEINNPVTYRSGIRYEHAKAYNVVAKVEGSDPQLKPLVVVTSRSGWWTVAAERGTGVAAWLAVAQRVAKSKPKRTVIFVSTTGQEYYSLGLKRFLRANPNLETNAYGWIYIGANIGAKPKPHYIVQSSSRQMRRMAERAFEKNGVEKIRWIDRAMSLVKPLGDAYAHSQHSLIIAATNNRCYRMTCDKWPSAVNVDATLAFAKSLNTVIDKLAQTAVQTRTE